MGASTLVGLGIAAGAIVLAGVSAASVVAQDRGLERETARIPSAERAVKALWFGVPRQTSWRELDGRARPALEPITGREPSAVLLYRQTRLGGALVDLGAADKLERWVRLRTGRLPDECRPERCEVVQIAGSGRLPSVSGLRLVKVGEATLASQVPFGAFISRERETSVVGGALRYHTAASPPFLLAEGVRGLAAAGPLASIYRSYGWVLPLEAGSVHSWEVDRFSAAVTRARASLEASSDLFDVTAPAEALAAARESGEIAGRRLLLIGGEAAALLLAFTILAASRMRRDVEAAVRRLTWFGARGWQLVLVPAGEAGAVALAAVGVGWIAGIGLAALIASRAGAPVQTTLEQSVLSGTGLRTAFLLALAAWLVVLVFVRVRPVRVGGLSVSALDVAALGALAVIALGLMRGEADPDALASEGGTGTFLVLLPALVVFVVAIAAARTVAPALRAAERLVRRGPVSARLASLSLARNPGQAAVAITFLAVSFGLALFAEVYRSTLSQGQEDQAAFAVPADFVLREDVRTLVPVVDAAPPAVYGSLGQGVETREVIRRSGDVTRLAGSAGLTLLGISAQELPGVEGWRNDFSDLSLSELARRIEPEREARLRALPLPTDARELRLRAALKGDDVTIAASVRTRRGAFVTVPLGETRGPEPVELRASLPAEARGGSLVALSFGIARDIHHDRGEGEAIREPTANGNLTLGPLEAAGAEGVEVLPVDYGEWLAGDGAHLVRESGSEARLALILTNEFPGRFRPRQPTDGVPVPAVVSPRLAAAAGANAILPVRLTSDQLRVRVVATAERFPSVEGDFVVVDRELAATALNADRAGAAVTSELWIEAPTAHRAALDERLRRPPFDVLELRSQRDVLTDLRDDPLGRATLLALIGAAAVALALALVGLLLVVLTDVRDDAGELVDLEAQGAGPGTLRRHLRLRTGAIASFGLAGGIVAGAALSALVVDFVTLTAGAAAAEPPLVLDVDWRVLALSFLGYGLAAGALVVLATWRAFRAEEAGRLREVAA